MANPLLNEKVFEQELNNTSERYSEQSMTVGGSINKSLFLMVLMITSASIFIYMIFNNHSIYSNLYPIIIGSAIAAVVLSITLSFKHEWAKPLSMLYAVLEGVVVGGISIMFAAVYDGIVFQAITITITVLFLMLVLYKFRIISVTEKFKSVMKLAIISIGVFYLASFIMGFFGMNFLAGNGPIQIGINIVIVVVAALSLLIDFDFIEKGAESNLPKYYEWYAAFGLLVTLIWLYLEILRLLSRLRER